VLRDPGTYVDEFVQEAIEEACETHPDIAVLHDNALGRRLAESGCQDAVIDGRSFRRIGVRRHRTEDGDAAVEYTVGSAGGHRDTRPNPGPIQHPATFEIFTRDPDTGGLRARVVTVRPDASVTLSGPVVVVADGDPTANANRPRPVFPGQSRSASRARGGT